MSQTAPAGLQARAQQLTVGSGRRATLEDAWQLRGLGQQGLQLDRLGGNRQRVSGDVLFARRACRNTLQRCSIICDVHPTQPSLDVFRLDACRAF